MTQESKGEVDRSVKAVKRTLAILDAFLTPSAVLTLGEISAASGLFKSVILRYMLTLEAEHYVFKRPDGSYQLGSRAWQLGAAYDRAFNLRQYIMPVLEKLMAATGESSTFYVREGEQRMCLLRVDSSQHLKSSVPVGTLLPMDDAPAASVLRHFAANQPKSRDRAGLIFSSSQSGENRYQPSGMITASIAAPVFRHQYQLVGALSVSGPINRFDPDNSATQDILLNAALELSRLLGG